MRNKLKNKSTPRSEVVTGLFSKPEAAHSIAGGVRHLHSSILGSFDPCVQTTHKLMQNEAASYPWDLSATSQLLTISESSERNSVWDHICSHTQFGNRSQNRSVLKQILEELLTNAIFHSYKKDGTKDKYDRLTPATLSPEEKVAIKYAEQKSGLYLCVTDRGGSLLFKHFTSCFKRCYTTEPGSISFDQKHEGAGIGLYLVFEQASHIHVSVVNGVETRFSLWIPHSGQIDPDNFSFNFFER